MRRNICDRLQQQQSKMNRNIVKRNTAKQKKKRKNKILYKSCQRKHRQKLESLNMRATALKISPQQKKNIKKKNTKKKYTQNSHNAPTLKANKKQQHIMKLICQKKRERERDKIEKLECIKRKAKQMIGQRNN